MLRLVRSADPVALADALADHLRRPAAGADPWAAEWVVAGGRSTERWLTAHLARALGVCAHVRFLSPSTLLEATIELALGLRADDVRAWSPGRLQWRVLDALPALLADPDAAACTAPLRAYLADGDAAVPPGSARAVALARRVADCFARYAVATPARMRAWGDAPVPRPGEPPEPDAARWQRRLWHALRAHGGDRAGDAAGAPLPALAERAFEALRAGRPARALPPRVVWLVQPPLAALHARALAELARAGVEVVALVLAPTRAAPGAEPALVRSLGRLASDATRVLDAACAEAGVVPVDDGWRARADGSMDASVDTLLARLRADLLDPDAARPPHALDAADGSLRVHACHGPMRQCEVLRDALLAELAADPTLHPRDVLVLTPDVATFAPLVEAAFGATPDGAALPVRVTDRPARRTNPAADVVLRVLALAAGRVDAVQVLDLVTLPAVAACVGLAEGDGETLRGWVREAGVRWGLDGDDRRAAHALPADDEHTWRFGLERLLLGWAAPGDGARTFGGALPYDEIEGSDAERLGRFAEACDRLFALVRRARAAQPVGDWAALVGDVLGALVDDAPALVLHRRAVQDAARRMVDEAGACAIPLDLAAARMLLEARLDDVEGSGGAAGAITLAALAPGRVVPSRVVALLGVDEARFPRPRAAAGFDLLAGGAVAGAADPPAEDRLRVLEALLAARDRLLVVYTGRTVDTNDEVAPAVPVGELLDMVDARGVRADGARDAEGHALAARTLVVRAHALQPFSPNAFAAEAPESHDAVHLAGARALRAERRPAPDFLTRPLPPADGAAPRVVTVDDLADFLAAPARTLVARRLGVRFDAPAELPVDDPLALDALERHGVRDALLRRLLDAPDLAAFDAGRALALLRADGALPHGALGALAFEREYADARRVAAPVRRWRARRACDAATVDRVVGAWRLVGRVGPVWYGGDDAWGPGLREAQPGRLRAKHQAALWVRHLALHLAPELAGEAPTSALASRPAGDGRPRHVCVIGAVAEPERCLADLLALYDAGTRGPVAYAPAASLAYAEAFDGKRTESDAHDTGLRDAARAWAPDFGVGELGGDAYLTRLFADADLTERDDFAARAQRVWGPFVRARVLRGDA